MTRPMRPAPWLVSCALALACAPALSRPSMAERVEAAALAHAAGLAGQVQVRVGGQVHALPACERPQAFMPPGSKPWGELLVGVRCEGGAAWTRFVPVQLQVSVRHAVAAQALPAGHRLGPADLQWVQADLAQLPRDAVRDEAAVAGAMTVHPVAAGAPLRRELLKAPPVIQQGQWVKVTAQGPGFVLSSEGRAQASAAAGQPVVLRMAGGQLVTALARPDGTADKTP